jgi:monofunctional biosynthetic peptidoglycan transglycosylase
MARRGGPDWRRLLRHADRGIRVLGALVLLFVLVTVLWVGWGRFIAPRDTLLMTLRAAEGYEVRRDWVPIDEISPHLLQAVIAAEDTKFCSHSGFDMEQIRKALSEAEDGGRLRGASTISQQTVKNVYLWPGRGFVRKGMEAWFTVLVEAAWPKHRILEAYLNVAEFGDGLFGAEAAAQARFGKSARDLSPREAALLAAVLPNPHEWRVDPPGPYVSRRSSTLLHRMSVIRRDGLDDCLAPVSGYAVQASRQPR